MKFRDRDANTVVSGGKRHRGRQRASIGADGRDLGRNLLAPVEKEVGMSWLCSARGGPLSSPASHPQAVEPGFFSEELHYCPRQ